MSTPREIITRKLRVTAPMAGEIEVTIDLTGIVDQIVDSVATRAYQNATGITESVTRVSLPGKAVLTEDTIITRNAHLRLNNVPRNSVVPKWEVIE